MSDAPDPFAALGLTPGPDLTDEQVRAAWRAIATATHPDRPDGGDPARYATASAAFQVLRTPWGRSEAYADLTARNLVNFRRSVLPPPVPSVRVTVSPWRAMVLIPARIRHGRPGRLVLRILAAAVLTVLVLRSGAPTPPVAGLLTRIATWLILT